MQVAHRFDRSQRPVRLRFPMPLITTKGSDYGRISGGSVKNLSDDAAIKIISISS